MKDVFRRNNCRLCGSNNFEFALKLSPTPLADSYIKKERLNEEQKLYPLDLMLCKKCGLSQILDVVNPEIIYRDYIYVTTSSMGLSDHFKGYAEHVIKKLGIKKESLVADIGSNDGTLLRHFKESGMKVLGIEPSVETAKHATEQGIETLPEFFSEVLSRKIVKEKGRVALVTINNLFANVDDLIDMTKGIRNILDDDGVFVFESFYLSDQIKNMVFDFTYHEHLSYFSLKPLKYFFEKYDLELFDVERVPTKGGSLRYFVQHKCGKKNRSHYVQELIDQEIELGLHDVDLFKKFEERINIQKKKSNDLLDSIKREGKTIAAFGGSATSTTLIYHFGLMDKIEFIVDDNPVKQNTFSPGCHIPVLPSKEIYNKKPDYILILAWRYFETIIKNNRKFIDQGGQFIVPLPELKVISS